ncbi:UNVERIFIED_CONTAM: hypothetical protein GTU68_056629 [Idotea baltica]|nr:hypothetical protein [Idotea baltica]
MSLSKERNGFPSKVSANLSH